LNETLQVHEEGVGREREKRSNKCEEDRNVSEKLHLNEWQHRFAHRKNV